MSCLLKNNEVNLEQHISRFNLPCNFYWDLIVLCFVFLKAFFSLVEVLIADLWEINSTNKILICNRVELWKQVCNQMFNLLIFRLKKCILHNDLFFFGLISWCFLHHHQNLHWINHSNQDSTAMNYHQLELFWNNWDCVDATWAVC